MPFGSEAAMKKRSVAALFGDAGDENAVDAHGSAGFFYSPTVNRIAEHRILIATSRRQVTQRAPDCLAEDRCGR